MSIEKEIMRLPEVCALAGIAKDSVYKLMRAGRFPKNRPMKDMPARKVWQRSEVMAWLNAQ